MTKKTVYLVRHGQTTYNRRWMHQYIAVPLSEEGHRQAKVLAEGLKKTPFDVLVSSDIARARETAEEISAIIGKEIIFEPLFRELDRPKEIVGKKFLSWRSVWVFAQLYLRAGNGTWRYDGEENFSEFRDRAHKAIEFMEGFDADTMVIVTHRIFIGGILAGLESKFAASMHQFIWKVMNKSAGIENCSITKLSYDAGRTVPWEVICIGDDTIVRGV
jgi:broad specificity phosphatase PhoE